MANIFIHSNHLQKTTPPLLDELEKKLLRVCDLVFDKDLHSKLEPRDLERPIHTYI